MVRWIAVIFFVFLTGCASRGPSNADRALDYLKIGTAHLNNGNYPAALNELLKAEKWDPENPVVQNNLGLAYFVRGKFSLAEKHIRQAIVLEPKYTEARNNLGRTLIELRLYDEAINELKKASQDLTYSSPDKTYSNLGLAYMKKGSLQMALTQFRRSLEMGRKNCLTYNYYGQTLFNLKEFAEAGRAFDQALPLCKKKKFAEPHYYSGLAYYQLGEIEQATARLNEVIHLYPDSEQAQKARDMLKIIR